MSLKRGSVKWRRMITLGNRIAPSSKKGYDDIILTDGCILKFDKRLRRIEKKLKVNG